MSNTLGNEYSVYFPNKINEVKRKEILDHINKTLINCTKDEFKEQLQKEGTLHMNPNITLCRRLNLKEFENKDIMFFDGPFDHGFLIDLVDYLASVYSEELEGTEWSSVNVGDGNGHFLQITIDTERFKKDDHLFYHASMVMGYEG